MNCATIDLWPDCLEASLIFSLHHAQTVFAHTRDARQGQGEGMWQRSSRRPSEPPEGIHANTHTHTHCSAAPGARPLRWGLAKSKSSEHVSGGAGWLMCSYCALSGDDISLAACKTYFALRHAPAKGSSRASRLTRIIIIYIYTHAGTHIYTRKRRDGCASRRRCDFFLKRPACGVEKEKREPSRDFSAGELSAAFKEIRL